MNDIKHNNGWDEWRNWVVKGIQEIKEEMKTFTQNEVETHRRIEELIMIKNKEANDQIVDLRVTVEMMKTKLAIISGGVALGISIVVSIVTALL